MGSSWPEKSHVDLDLVFSQPDGTPVSPNSFTKTMDRLVGSSGLPRIRLHDLRHTRASIGLAAGVDPKLVQERLGHSTIAITMDTYSHVTPGQDAVAADVMAQAVFGARGSAPAGSS
jgi:integrase